MLHGGLILLRAKKRTTSKNIYIFKQITLGAAYSLLLQTRRCRHVFETRPRMRVRAVTETGFFFIRFFSPPALEITHKRTNETFDSDWYFIYCTKMNTQTNEIWWINMLEKKTYRKETAKSHIYSTLLQKWPVFTRFVVDAKWPVCIR